MLLKDTKTKPVELILREEGREKEAGGRRSRNTFPLTASAPVQSGKW